MQNTSNLSFKDPRATNEKEFELHTRTKLPKKVSKCQGKCGKAIEKTDKLVVKSYGTMSWTDKNTGKEKQKFGPMYVHFKEECLKAFSEEFYAPGDRFDFTKIKLHQTARDDLKKEDLDFLSNLGIN